MVNTILVAVVCVRMDYCTTCKSGAEMAGR